jgi:hypothetical protein
MCGLIKLPNILVLALVFSVGEAADVVPVV